MAKRSLEPWLAAAGFGPAPDFPEDELRTLPGMANGVSWMPAADAYETPDGWVVEAELPGVDPAEVRAEVHGGALWVWGVRHGTERGQAAFLAAERSFGPFARRLVLPQGVDPAGIRAELRLGVLTVTLPRRARPGRRTIPVG
ncbi:MAG: Hsp20/alpha crystallin family protein [Desulfovibrionaceae bacterium]